MDTNTRIHFSFYQDFLLKLCFQLDILLFWKYNPIISESYLLVLFQEVQLVIHQLHLLIKDEQLYSKPYRQLNQRETQFWIVNPKVKVFQVLVFLCNPTLLTNLLWYQTHFVSLSCMPRTNQISNET
jgi:hypothetical protein